jgi:hypothetical protein
VLDANWRWLHTTTGYTNCYTGNTWDTSLCPDGKTGAANCALDGADYSGTYGITTSGNALTLKFKTGSNIGSRVYLLASDTAYEMFKLKNQEFTFDVDVSNLGCGLNGAVYFSEMDADGGMSKYSTNKAGAKYGTGYCDSQCPHDLKFINGEVGFLFFPGYILVLYSLLIPCHRLTARAGPHPPTTRTLVPVNTDLAVTKWISGRPTRSRPPIPPTVAPSKASTAARVLSAVMATTAMVVSATRTVATSTRTVWATLLSMALARPLILAPSSPS